MSEQIGFCHFIESKKQMYVKTWQDQISVDSKLPLERNYDVMIICVNTDFLHSIQKVRKILL